MRPIACYRQLLTVIVCLFAHSIDAGSFHRSEKVPLTTYQYRVIADYPHDKKLFTQGVEWHKGKLYESGGHYRQSSLVRRSLNSQQPELIRRLPDEIFAEGITILDDVIYQLSWKSGRGFRYRLADLELLGEFRIQGQGWGLTNNGKQLILSDGSETLRFIDPQSFDVIRRIEVRLGEKPLRKINELEWVNGLLYANVWQSNRIVMIDPTSGAVIGQVKLDGLPAGQIAGAGVLNGIATLPSQPGQPVQLLVTGKYWSSMYHIEIFRQD